VYRVIWRERIFYSHPAIVDVDHIIRHFPEHRKVALLADEPPPAAFNAFTIAPTTYALGLFIASAGFDGGPALRRSGTSSCLGSAGRTPARSQHHLRALASGSLPTARAARPAALQATALA
jgi:hypothetical protein